MNAAFLTCYSSSTFPELWLTEQANCHRAEGCMVTIYNTLFFLLKNKVQSWISSSGCVAECTRMCLHTVFQISPSFRSNYAILHINLTESILRWFLAFSAVKLALTVSIRGLRGREEQGGQHPGLPVGDRLSLSLHLWRHWKHGQACHAHVNQVTAKAKGKEVEVSLVLMCKIHSYMSTWKH